MAFTPRLVRGLSYYTGPIWEVVAEGVPGSLAGGGRYDHLIDQLGGPDVPATGGSLGIERILLMLPPGEEGHSRLDVAVTVMDERYAARSFAFAAAARSAGLRASVYLGASGKLGRQLKWASDQGARWSLIYGGAEDEAGTVTVRDMTTGEQTAVPAGELGDYLARLAAEGGARPAISGPRCPRQGQRVTRSSFRAAGRDPSVGGADFRRDGVVRERLGQRVGAVDAVPRGGAEHGGEMALHHAQHVGDGDGAAGLGGQAGDSRVPDAAGHDPVEPAEVAVAVEREAVHGDAARHPDADRATLRSCVLPGPRPPVIQTPLRPSTRVVATPTSAQARISASSRART